MPQRDGTAEVQQLVASFFAAVETNDWATTTTLLAEQVQVGHGEAWERLTNEQLTASWEASHSRFATTEYCIDPLRIEVDNDRAIAHLAASISLVPPPSQAPTVRIAGQYTIQLERVGDTWQIHSLHHRMP